MNAFEAARLKTGKRLERAARQEAAKADLAAGLPMPAESLIREFDPPMPVVSAMVPSEKGSRDLIIDVRVYLPSGNYTFALTKKNIHSHVPAHRVTSDELRKLFKDALQKAIGAVD